ncbi:MAG: CRISPR-associated helicase Cas3' [Vicinamibacterales bacterium]
MNYLGAGKSDPLNSLWAKLSRDKSNPPSYHPLLAHLIDVAQVAHAMWRDVLPTAARAHVASALGMTECPEAAGRWIAFFAGLHDLGKASPAFARQDARAWDRIRASGFPSPPEPFGDRLPHGWISAHTLPTLLSAPPYALPPLVANVAGVAVGGHHGIFPSPSVLRKVTMEPDEAGRGRWRDARRDLVSALADALGYPAPAPSPLTLDLVTAMYLAGLTSVADWIGSNADFFPYVLNGETRPAEWQTPRYWPAYAAGAADKARRALGALGWLGAAAPSAPSAFVELFPFAPNSLQATAVDVATRLDGPALVVIEAPMGLGKTEAALFLADHLAASLGQRGFYFSLPTQATSNQMLSRLRPFLARRYPDDLVNLQLLHGHAALSAELQVLRQNADRLFAPTTVDDDESPGHDDQHVLAAEWFTYRKRGLLAPFGVGTVDQALLAVLQAKHVFVRLFGLAHTVVIIDEVHAYDTYMSALLGRLLEWLAALGASVILLSATLPCHRREQLLRAYAAGRGALDSDAIIVPTLAYPRITWSTQSGANARAVATKTETVTVAVEPIEDPFVDDSTFGARADAVARRLEHVLRDGGCAAVIVSTVRRAQRLYDCLRRWFPDNACDGLPQLDLFHARYLFEDRDAREKRTLLRFGKPGARVIFDDGTDLTVERPHRAVLVATQVIEQSLDLDFDLMVTDLAPADLVLQRIGRLHRHSGRSRPTPLQKPALWLLLPPVSNGVPTFGRDQIAVYDEHPLLRSWLDLRGRKEIMLPDEIETIVEAIYDEREPSPDLSPALLAAWNETRADLAASIAKEEHEADKRWIASPTSSRQLWQLLQDPREEDAPENHPAHQALTRLAELTAPVVLLYGPPDQPSLDPAGRQPIDLRATPDLPLAQALLRRSVGLSDRRIVYALAAQAPPPSWRRSALLRHHRLLVLDANGRAAVDARHTHRLDPDLGVVVDG